MKISIGIVAPSAQVPEVEFELGVERLKREGFAIRVHPQVRKSSLFFAGSDEVRASAFYDFAADGRFDVIWGARGGHGAIRILPLLDRLTSERGIPERKLLVGYSDSTALLEFVRVRWGWPVLHAPMPGLRKFSIIKESEWRALVRLVRGELVAAPWKGTRLRFAGTKPKQAISAGLVGGNLSMMSALVGTPYAIKARGKILFLEDLGETLYRVDRMVQQLLLAGALDQVKAIVLGDFLDCPDRVTQVLAYRPTPGILHRMVDKPEPGELKPLRKELPARKTLHRIFAEAAERLGGIPVAYGLPAGHGPGFAPVPLGAEATLDSKGQLRIDRWPWARGGGRA